MYLITFRQLLIKFTKVQGHSGIHGNEKADQLAKSGALSDKQLNCNPTFTNIKHFIIN